MGVLQDFRLFVDGDRVKVGTLGKIRIFTGSGP